MTTMTLIRQNLLRNKRRTTLTIIAVTFPLMIFTFLMAIQRGMTEFARMRASELRLAVTQKVSIINGLPLAHRKRIEQLDTTGARIRAVSAMRWFGGKVPGEQHPIPSLGTDRDNFAVCYPEYEMTPEDEQRWLNTRNGAVVGKGLARARGWKVGQRLTLKGSIPPYAEMEFKIIYIGGRELDDSVFFPLDYMDEVYEQVGGRTGFANLFWVKCNDPADLPVLTREIDELFRYDLYQTLTQTEAAFFESFARQQGNLPVLVKAIGGFVVFVVVMVNLNTMSMAFRERINEMAVFRALGFGPGYLLGLMLGESLLIALLAALVGCVPIYVLTNIVPVSLGPIPGITVSPIVLAEGIGIALLIGLAAGIGPAVWAGRVKVVAALRRVV